MLYEIDIVPIKDNIKDMNNLRIILNIALSEEAEHNVTGLALGILSVSGKDIIHGYLVRSEHRIAYGRPDITVEVLKNRVPLLIIECKRNSIASTLKKGGIQTQAYMVDGDFPYGVLLTPQLCFYYIKDKDGVPELACEYSNIEQLEDIIKLIKNLPEDLERHH